MSQDDATAWFNSALERQKASDFAGSHDFYARGAASDHSPSQVNLARLQERGLGLPADFPSAIDNLRRAATSGDSLAKFNLGRLLADMGSHDEARRFLSDAEAEGVEPATLHLLILDLRTETNGDDLSRAVERLHDYADVDDYAACWLADCFLNGRGVERDTERARSIFEELADRDVDHGLFNLALFELDTYGEQSPSAEAISAAASMLERAADSGLIDACSYAGEMYAMGWFSRERQVERSLSWLEAAASYGDLRARYVLCLLAIQEQIPVGDPTDRVRDCFEAAQAGDADAQCTLGLLYDRGQWVPKSRRLFRFWMRRSIENGGRGAPIILVGLESDRPYLKRLFDWIYDLVFPIREAPKPQNTSRAA